MKGLETGLKVGDIATYGFLCCQADEDASEVMQRAELLPYDCIPVKKGGHIAGVLERNGEVAPGTAGDVMRALHDGLLVAADEPLKGFIPLLVDTPHRLVVRGSRIEGIVTSSDIHKLPVRLLAFALVTHLEMTMAAVIGHTWEDDRWIELLNDGRRAKVPSLPSSGETVLSVGLLSSGARLESLGCWSRRDRRRCRVSLAGSRRAP